MTKIEKAPSDNELAGYFRDRSDGHAEWAINCTVIYKRGLEEVGKPSALLLLTLWV